MATILIPPGTPRVLTCKDCLAFRPSGEPEMNNDEMIYHGLCARNPPEVMANEGAVFSAQPDVDGNKDWCLQMVRK